MEDIPALQGNGFASRRFLLSPKEIRILQRLTDVGLGTALLRVPGPGTRAHYLHLGSKTPFGVRYKLSLWRLGEAGQQDIPAPIQEDIRPPASLPGAVQSEKQQRNTTTSHGGEDGQQHTPARTQQDIRPPASLIGAAEQQQEAKDSEFHSRAEEEHRK